MNMDKLRASNKKILEDLARKKGIAGWHAMRKEDLIDALAAVNGNGHSNGNGKTRRAAPKAHATTKAVAKPAARPQAQKSAARNSSGSSSTEEQVERSKFDVGVPTRDLSARVPKHLPSGYGKDRIVVMVRDPYWLHAYWEVTRQSIARAEAALGQEWHGAKPILRLLDVTTHDTTSTAEAIVKDIEIHGGCNNWYIDVHNPPRSFRVDIGYLSRHGQFYVLSRSNVVSTPRAGVSDLIDENWADIDAKKADRIYAMSGGFDPSMSSLELKD